jgi:hypothetical protein
MHYSCLTLQHLLDVALMTSQHCESSLHAFILFIGDSLRKVVATVFVAVAAGQIAQ